MFLSGLLGGHSGVDIALGRANANKLLNKIILKSVNDFNSLLLISFDGGLQLVFFFLLFFIFILKFYLFIYLFYYLLNLIINNKIINNN